MSTSSSGRDDSSRYVDFQHVGSILGTPFVDGERARESSSTEEPGIHAPLYLWRGGDTSGKGLTGNRAADEVDAKRSLICKFQPRERLQRRRFLHSNSGRLPPKFRRSLRSATSLRSQKLSFRQFQSPVASQVDLQGQTIKLRTKITYADTFVGF